MKINDIEKTIAKIVNCGLRNVLTEDDVIELLREVNMLRKAYDLMAEELAVNKHCVMFPNCYIELDEEDCMLKEACHNKEWLKEYYLQKAWEENED